VKNWLFDNFCDFDEVSGSSTGYDQTRSFGVSVPLSINQTNRKSRQFLMANSYDRIFKENIEPLQLPLLAKLLGLIPPKLVAIDAKMQVTQEAEMDSIRRVAHPDAALDYGLRIEFHIVDEDLRWRNLLHYGLFYQITRLPLRQIVIYGGIAPPKKITG
jgi:hypothetical protein